MRCVLAATAAVLAAGSALAESPVIEEITDLRQQLGQPTTSHAEFAQAVRNVAEQRQALSADPGPVNEPQAWAGDYRADPWQAAGPQQANRFFQPPPGRAMAPANNSGWAQDVVPAAAEGRGPYPPGPQPVLHPAAQPYGPPTPPPRPAKRTPQTLLQDSAFELDRMAHELERAELYGEADSLREAAGRLRESARRQRKPDQHPGPAPVFSTTPDRHPMAAERARRAVQEANERAERTEQKLREAQTRLRRQAEEVEQRMRDEERRLRRLQREAERQRDSRPERPDQGQFDLPAQGVHGGPYGSAPEAEEPPRQEPR